MPSIYVSANVVDKHVHQLITMCTCIENWLSTSGATGGGKDEQDFSKGADTRRVTDAGSSPRCGKFLFCFLFSPESTFSADRIPNTESLLSVNNIDICPTTAYKMPVK